jgi:hypothetical protein
MNQISFLTRWSKAQRNDKNEDENQSGVKIRKGTRR